MRETASAETEGCKERALNQPRPCRVYKAVGFDDFHHLGGVPRVLERLKEVRACSAAKGGGMEW